VQIEVQTQSQTIDSWQAPPTPPTITIDGNAIGAASNKPYTASGWQLVVLDSAHDLTQPSSVLSNMYTSLPQDDGSWGYWEGMYDLMLTQALTSGDTGLQIVIAATFGLDGNLPPTNTGLEMLLGYGAGSQVQAWETDPDLAIGSEGPNWTNYPTNYILIGASGLGFGLGTEAFEFSTGNEISTSATAMFANPGAVLAAA
jgi:hypothetical protein